MSKISGHFELTNAALQEFRRECAGNALAAGIQARAEGTRAGMSDAFHFVGGSVFLLLPADTPTPAHGAIARCSPTRGTRRRTTARTTTAGMAPTASPWRAGTRSPRPRR